MVVRLEFVGEGWPGSDQAHFTTRDIEELRNFIERGSAQPAADARHSVVVDELVDRLAVAVAVTRFRFLAIKHLPDQLAVSGVWSTIPHGPKLPHPEPPPTRADPVLAEEHR